MISTQDHERFRDLLVAQPSVILATHINPDGDAIGSEVGLAEYLLNLGRQVRVINHDPTPEFLKFLQGPRFVVEVYDPARHDAELKAAARIALLDNSAPDRLGRMEAVMRAAAEQVFCIDHHPTRGTPWKYNIIDEKTCATAALIFELTTRDGWRPTKIAAQAMYAGLATDTGFFRFNSTSARAHSIAAELLAAGAEPATCYQEIFERTPASHARLLGEALRSLALLANGVVASMRITMEMAERCGAAGADTSEMTTVLLGIDGVRVALLFREIEDHKVKVSLRSKGALDVHRLASAFGGGGHRNASGIVIAGELADVEAQVLRAAADLVAPQP